MYSEMVKIHLKLSNLIIAWHLDRSIPKCILQSNICKTTSTEDKSVDTHDCFYKVPERILDQLSKYHTEILLADFNSKLGGKNILKSTVGNESW